MAILITVPRLGWNMEEGTFGGWLKADGDAVRPGDGLFTLESEKATEEVESLDGGVLRIPANGPRPGDRLLVGAVIGYLLKSADEQLPTTGVASIAPQPSIPEPVASPAVRRIARQRGIELGNVRGSGPGGRILEGDLAGPARGPVRPELVRSSPRARRAARDLGIDWTTLRGSGSTGRIRERDVRAGQVAGTPPATGPGPIVPLTPIRRTIAARMLESQRLTAPVTLTTTADATNLVNLRDQFKTAGDGVPSYTDFLVKLVAGALVRQPLLGGRWTDDGIRLPATIDIGIAVDTDSGLLVPVIRDVPGLSIRQLATTARQLVNRARTGRLTAADMQGGCFTISNLGAYGIDSFTPIINYPECAVLGVGRIARRPAVVGDAIVPRDQVTLSLTFDHRIVDGAPAARFLQMVAQAVENPAPWVMS